MFKRKPSIEPCYVEEIANFFRWRKMEPIACWMISDINIKQIDKCGLYSVVLTVMYASAKQDEKGQNFNPNHFIAEKQQQTYNKNNVGKYLLGPWSNICIDSDTFKMSATITQRQLS